MHTQIFLFFKFFVCFNSIFSFSFVFRVIFVIFSVFFFQFRISEAHGRALILDGIIQCTEKDEFSYQEMISFIPLCCHPKPETVLIVGGGDGGVARVNENFVFFGVFLTKERSDS